MNETELQQDLLRNKELDSQKKVFDAVSVFATESAKSFSGFVKETIKSNDSLAYSICKTNESMVNHYVSQPNISEESKERIIKYGIDSNERIVRHANIRTEVGVGLGLGLAGLGLFFVASKNTKSSSNP